MTKCFVELYSLRGPKISCKLELDFYSESENFESDSEIEFYNQTCALGIELERMSFIVDYHIRIF